MDKVRTEWLRVQFCFVTAVSESVGTGIRFHYTTDVKIILLYFHRVYTLRISSNPLVRIASYRQRPSRMV